MLVLEGKHNRSLSCGELYITKVCPTRGTFKIVIVIRV